MKIYLIDYENAKNLSGIKNLSEEDLVVIFYSEKASSLPFEYHFEILASKAKIEYKCVNVGVPNALDFQLDSYLGYLLKEYEEKDFEISIVAGDKGYDYVASFWKKEKSVEIRLLKGLSEQVAVGSKAPESSLSELEIALIDSKIPLNEEDFKAVVDMALKYKTVQTINGNLNKLFKGSTRAGEVLKVIKPFIKKK